MSDLPEPRRPEGFELRGTDHTSRRSAEREDADATALRQAGKSPVLKVCFQNHLHELSGTR